MRRLGRHRGLPRRLSLLLAALVAVTLLDSATLAGAAVLHARRLERGTSRGVTGQLER